MTTDVTSLVMEVDSRQVKRATSDLAQLARQGKSTESAVGAIGRSFMAGVGGLVAGLGGLALATSAVKKAINVQREFDVLNAGLITATGSAQGAAQAFSALEQFAAKTPYSLQQSVEAFTKLTNLGLTPSEQALTSYGNTAAAMGKDLSQMVEAVADATTGEFERLKEFGIKAKVEGDNVTFRFKGMKTSIKNDAQEIEKYLVRLGETNFAGAMENRMRTLDGALSNLGDAWDSMFRNIMAADLGDGMQDMVRDAIAALEQLTTWIKEGRLEGAIETMSTYWEPFRAAARDVLDGTMMLLGDFESDVSAQGPTLLEELLFAWASMPARVTYYLDRVSAGLRQYMLTWINMARTFAGTLSAVFDGPGGQTVRGALGEGAGRQATINQERRETDAASAELRRLREERAARGVLLLTRGRKVKTATGGLPTGGGNGSGSGGGGGSDKATREAEKRARDLENVERDLATEEEKIRESYRRRQETIDSSLKAQSDAHAKLSARNKERLDRELAELAESQGREAEQLRMSLMSEEEQIEASYKRRLRIIAENNTLSEEQKAELRTKVEEDRERELNDLKVQQQRAHDAIWEGYMTEEELLKLHHERRRELILSSTAITEQERQELLRREEEKFLRESAMRERQRMLMITQSVGDMFGALSQLMSTYAQGNDKNAKRNFKIAQAFGIAQAVISTATGIAKAQELGYPMNIFESIRVGAVGAAQIAAIKSQNFAGGYDKGGYIPAGKIGVVGEYGPELAEGPMRIRSRRETAELMREAQSGNPRDTGRAAQPMVFNFHLSSEKQVDDFRRSRRQIEADLARTVRRVQQN